LSPSGGRGEDFISPKQPNMNRKSFFRVTFFVCLFLSATNLTAQDYKTAVGIGAAIGNEAGLAGPTVKHFFSEKSAVHADVFFESYVTLTHLIYQHHMPVKGSTGLKFFTGGGPGLEFYESEIDFLVALKAGLEYKIKKAP